MKSLLTLLGLFFFSYSLMAQCDASFTASATTVCGNEVVVFSVNNPPASGSYDWNFNPDAQSSQNASNITAVFPASLAEITYTVSLTITTQDTTCTSFTQITVLPTPEVDIEGDFSECISSGSDETTFSTTFGINNPSGNYDWFFGDGTFALDTSATVISHDYEGYGSYLLQVAQSIGNCTDTFSMPVNFFRRPSADMEIFMGFTDVCEGDSVIIENGTTSEVTFFVIDWGDGIRDTVFNTDNQVHTYVFDEDLACTILEGDGFQEFDIELIAVAGENCVHDNGSPVNIIPLPRPRFTADTCICIDDNPITFTNNSCNKFGNSYTWDFGDPASGADNTSTDIDGTHSFSAPGIYTVELTATSSSDCGTNSYFQTIEVVGEAEASFTIDGPQITCEPTNYTLNSEISGDCARFEWTITPPVGFLNGTNINSPNPEIVVGTPGIYVVELEVINPCGTATQVDTIFYAEEPTITLPATPDACGGADFTFEPTIDDNGCDIESCSWVFTNDDGDIVAMDASCGSISLPFNDPDIYYLEFTATNCCGPTTIRDTFIVSEIPVADATYTLDPECVPAIATFENLSINNFANSWTINSTLDWEFINGTDENSENPIVQFNEPGSYPIELNISGCEDDTWTETIEIFAAPSVSLDPVPASDDCGTITFTPTATIDDGGCDASCEWTITGVDNAYFESFSGCTPSSVNINETGEYILELTVINCCDTVIVTENFSVSAFPVANATVDLGDAFGCAPTVIDFINISSFNDENKWTITAGPSNGTVFTNGTDMNSENPSFQINERGEYTFQLMASNGCDQSVWDTTLTFYESPSATLIAIEDACDELTFTPATSSLDNGGCDANCEWILFRDGAPQDTFMVCDPSEITVNQAGNYTLELNLMNCCETITLSEDFFIQASVPTSAGADTSLCIGDPCLQLPSNGVWTDEDGNIITEFCPETVDTFELTFTQTTNLCSSSDGLTVIVNPLPDVQIDGVSAISACINDPVISLTASPLNGTWNSTSDGLDEDGNFDPAQAGIGIHFVTYTFTDSLSCTNSDEIIITINGLQNYILPDTSFCEAEQNINLETEFGIDESSATCTWQGLGIVDADAGLFNTDSAGGAGVTVEIIHTVTTNNFCTSVDTFNITIIAREPADIGPDQTVCITDETLQLTANLPGEWESPSATISNSGEVHLNSSGAGMHDIYFVAFEGESCEARDTLVLTILDMSPVEAGPDLYLCESEGTTSLSGFSLPADAIGTWSGIDFQDAVNGVFDVQELNPGTYTLYYTATSSILGTCTDLDSTQLIIDSLPIPNFSIEGTPCIDEPITFINESSGADAYCWRINGNKEGTSADLPFVFTTAGSYTVELIAYTINPTNALDTLCEESYTETLNISEPPTFVGFTAEPTEGCALLEVLLTNQSEGENLSFIWTANGDTISTASDSVLLSLGDGIVDVETVEITLTVDNSCGGDIAIDTLTVFPRPIADFTIAQDTFCSGQDIPIIITSANVGNPDSIAWLLDGVPFLTSTALIDPDNFFIIDSVTTNHELSLIAINECGVDTLTQEIVIAPTDVEAFFAISDTLICLGDTIFVENAATFDVNVFYDFGDSTNFSNGPNAFVVYDTPGVYTITQQAFGCGFDSFERTVTVQSAPSVNFFIDPLHCPESIVIPQNNTTATAFSWYLNDSLVSVLGEPEIFLDTPGVYTITLVAANQFSCSADFSQEITVLNNPIANFNFSDTLCNQRDIQFTNTSTADFAYSCEWDFGDGNSSTDCDPIHVYDDPGLYTVCLLITDINGCRDEICQIVNVRATPVPAFEYEVLDLCSPSEVIFTNLSDSANAYVWFFGDDSISMATNPTHIYLTGDTFTVTLQALNDNICVASISQEVIIQQTPTANFTADNFSICAPDSVRFTDMSVGSIQTYRWDFGDTFVSFEQNPVHFYDTPGTYPVTLIVDTGFCRDTIQQVVTVFEPVLADYSVQDIACFGDTNGAIDITIQNGTPPYEFDWGDNVFTEDRDMLSAGIYSLTIIDDNGCTWDETIEVSQPDSPISIAIIESIPATCFGDSNAFLRVAASGGVPTYSYSWSNGVQDSVLADVLAGFYDLTVTDANNCESVFQIEALQNEALGVVDTSLNITCFGEQDGIIQVDSVFGGIPPYILSIEGSNGYFEQFQLNGNSGQLFDQLGPAVYSLLLEDSQGCWFQKDYTIFEPSEVIVEILQGDTLVQQGATVALPITHNVSIPIINWTPPDSLSCLQCDEPIARPTNTTQYQVTLSDENGCFDTDEVTINVEISRDVYIPNAFTPDDSGFNDRFLIRSNNPGVVEVLEFKIFDRYGAILFEAFDFQPNDYDYGWDGNTAADEPVQPGIYTYYALIEYYDGEEVLWEGKILLIR